MHVAFGSEDLKNPEVGVNGTLIHFGGATIWFRLTLEERCTFLHEWLEAEEDHEAGQAAKILGYLADERNMEVSARDPGPVDTEVDTFSDSWEYDPVVAEAGFLAAWQRLAGR